MGVLTFWRGIGVPVDPTDPPADLTDLTETAERLQIAEGNLALLQESLADAQLAMDDAGWERITRDAANEFTRDGHRRACALAQLQVVQNPLIRRGLGLRVAYVWGSGVQTSVKEPPEGGQDVNAVVQGFLDDPSNTGTFTTGQANEENERALGTDGNLFLALFTNPLTGRVQVRVFPFAEIDEKITDPDDRASTWFYRRTVTITSVGATTQTGTGRTITALNSRQVTTYHPALGYRPRQRPRTITDTLGTFEVLWDAPILHVAVNRLAGWSWGIGDAYAAIWWARGYKEFLEDWARLVKALSRFAWHATSKTGRGRAQTRDALRAQPTVNPTTGAPNDTGATAVTSADVSLTAIPKTGATIDSESGRPLAAMVAAALGVPVTMLLGDPGQTGARAVAETLDQPMELEMTGRRELWGDVRRRVLGHVIDQAIKAPQGALHGTVRIDPATGREVITLAGDQDRSIDVDWPDLGKEPIDVLITAITKADSTGKVPPEVTARLLLQALGVDDVDELIAGATDPTTGEFVAPAAAAAAADATAAALAALEAVRTGDYPTDR